MRKSKMDVVLPEGTQKGDYVVDEDGQMYEVMSLGESEDHDDHEVSEAARRKRRTKVGVTTRMRKKKGGGYERVRTRRTAKDIRDGKLKYKRNRMANLRKGKQYRRKKGKSALKRQSVRRGRARRSLGLESVHESLQTLSYAVENLHEGLMDQISMGSAGGADIDIIQPVMDYTDALDTNALIANNLAMLPGAESLGVPIDAMSEFAAMLGEDADLYESGELTVEEAHECVVASTGILRQVMAEMSGPF